MRTRHRTLRLLAKWPGTFPNSLGTAPNNYHENMPNSSIKHGRFLNIRHWPDTIRVGLLLVPKRMQTMTKITLSRPNLEKESNLPNFTLSSRLPKRIWRILALVWESIFIRFGCFRSSCSLPVSSVFQTCGIMEGTIIIPATNLNTIDIDLYSIVPYARTKVGGRAPIVRYPNGITSLPPFPDMPRQSFLQLEKSHVYSHQQLLHLEIGRNCRLRDHVVCLFRHVPLGQHIQVERKGL